jgi:dUTP pyrophosphatase
MRFEKVSYDQFAADMEKWMPDMSKMLYKRFYDRVTLPKRQTAGSAGYDFVTPVRIMLEPGQQAVIPSGIRAVFSEEELETWHLEVFVRSSIGLKKDGILPNSVAIIDADYFQGENGGDILLALKNTSRKIIDIAPEERICQGIFKIHGLTSDDDAEGHRSGGVGSTGKQ